MHAFRRAGFTLVELLVVIAVIAILAAVAIPAVMGALESARGSTATNKLAEVSKGTVSHAASNRGYLPLPAKDQSSAPPTFGTSSDEEDVWYNSLAQHLSIAPLTSINANGFYSASSVYYIPGAKYRKSDLKGDKAYFAFGMNVNLANWGTGGERRIKETTLSVPGKTVLFAEGGLPEERMPSKYSGGVYQGACAVAANNFAARYKRNGIIAFGDNHVERVPLEKVVSTSYSQQTDRTKTDISWKTDGSDLP